MDEFLGSEWRRKEKCWIWALEHSELEVQLMEKEQQMDRKDANLQTGVLDAWTFKRRGC